MRLYGELAGWWPLLSAPAEYAREATWYRDALRAAGDRPAATLLELGSGGGNNAVHLKQWFRLTLVDLSPEMSGISRRLNPDCEHLIGDMRDLRLARTFDRVFLHDAVMYLTTAAELRAALATAFAHCRPGGGVVVVPDHVSENFIPGTSAGGHDGADGRGLRYLSWTVDPDPTDSQFLVDYAILLREADGTVRTAHDRHRLGLFPTSVWMETLAAVGFDPQARPFDCEDVPPDRVVFTGTRPRG